MKLSWIDILGNMPSITWGFGKTWLATIISIPPEVWKWLKNHIFSRLLHVGLKDKYNYYHTQPVDNLFNTQMWWFQYGFSNSILLRIQLLYFDNFINNQV